ncbi:hypothetical protein [Prevotella aurantiaca]
MLYRKRKDYRWLEVVFIAAETNHRQSGNQLSPEWKTPLATTLFAKFPCR